MAADGSNWNSDTDRWMDSPGNEHTGAGGQDNTIAPRQYGTTSDCLTRLGEYQIRKVEL
jgi:hypothetical protein